MFCVILVFFVSGFPLSFKLIKWSEMDPNVKPQTEVESFEQAKSNSILECMYLSM